MFRVHALGVPKTVPNGTTGSYRGFHTDSYQGLSIFVGRRFRVLD